MMGFLDFLALTLVTLMSSLIILTALALLIKILWKELK